MVLKGPIQHILVGPDGRIPTFRIGRAEAYQVVMGALDIRRRGIEERTGGEEQRPGFAGQYGASRHAALVGSAPVAFGQPVLGFLGQFGGIIERLGERRQPPSDFEIYRR